MNTGEVVAGDPTAGQRLVTGDAVNVAARLEQAAGAGRGPARRVDLPPRAGRRGGRARRAARAEGQVRARAGVPAAPRCSSTRPATSGTSTRRWSGARRSSSCSGAALERAATSAPRTCSRCSAPPGSGSRGSCGSSSPDAATATVLRGRCLSYGEGITYYAARRDRAAGRRHRARADDPATVAREARRARSPTPRTASGSPGSSAGCSAGPSPAAPEDAALGRAQAPRAPRAATGRSSCVFDDIHWAEPTLLDLIEHLADWTRDAELLLVCVARPELLEIRPGWGGGKMNATSILLEPLAGDEAGALLDNLLGGADLPGDRPRADPRGGRGQPAVRRGDARHADRRRAAAVRGRRVARRRRPRRPHGAADDPAAARRAARPARRRGARRDRARRRRGQGLPHGRRDVAGARGPPRRRCGRGCSRSRARS